MFTTLHALAKQATLMITIAREGDDQLRVNVTPVPADTKAKSNLPQPLSLVATPTEFDADFIAALSTWQAPKRTLLQQAQDATGAPRAPAASPAPSTSPAPKQADKQPEKGKPGRKRIDKTGADAEPANLQAASDAAGEAAADVDQVMAGGAPAAPVEAAPAGPDDDAAPAPADGDEPVDTFTLDLF